MEPTTQPNLTSPAVDPFNIPELPELPNDCPISELLGKRVTQMSDDELAKHVAELRSAVESPQSLRKLIATKSTKAKSAKTAAPNLSLLDL